MLLGPPNLSGVVASYSFPITVSDYGPDANTDGMIGVPAPVGVASIGHFYPASGEDITRLELQSPGAVFKVHTPRPDLRAAVKGSELRGSLVTPPSGKTYEVVALSPWTEGPSGTETWHEATVQEVLR